MTVYEGTGEEFRPRPSLLSLASVSFFFLLLNLGLTSLVASITEELLSRFAGATGSAFLYAPFAGRHLTFFDNASILRIYLHADDIIAAVALLVAVMLLYFWPGEPSLASRLYVQLFALALVTWGALPRAFDPETWAKFEKAFWTSRQEAVAISGAIGLLALIVVFLSERKTFVILSNLFDTDTPGKRLVLWLVRLPLPLVVAAALCWFNGFRSGAYAAAAVLFVTLLETVSHLPVARFEKIASPYMREAAAAAPVVVLPLLAAQIWTFGFRPAELPPRVVQFESLSKVRRISIETAESVAPMSHAKAAEEEKPQEEKKIDIRWSNEKKKAPAQRRK